MRESNKSEPADTVAVKMNWKDKLINWALGDTIQQKAEEIVRQAAASKGVDPDDDQWRGVLQSRRDLTPIDQDRLIEISNYLAAQNPLAKAICDIRRDFVIGDGVTFEAEDSKAIQPLIDQLITDPVNNWDEFQFDLVKYLYINGELLLPVFVNEFNGQVRLGWIDPFEVERVIADRENRRIMRQVVMKPGASAGSSDYYTFTERRAYDIVNVDTNPRSKTFGMRTGALLFFRNNCAPDARRGRSSLESWADLADSWDQFTYTNLERARMLNHFIWDVILNGKSEEEIEEWVRKQAAPKPGSLRAHNENVTWAAVAPDLKAGETTALADNARKNTLGAARLAEFFFGITEGANRASSENLDLPLLKGLQSDQRKMRAVFREIVDFSIDQMAMRRPIIRQALEAKRSTFGYGKASVVPAMSRAVEIKMPELSTRDLSRVGSILGQVAASLDSAMSRAWITTETSARIFAGMMAQLGFEYDVDKELKGAKKEADENAAKDYTDERVTQLRAVTR